MTSINTIKRVVKNTVAITASSIITLILGFILTVALARYLGPRYYGIFAFATAFVALFNVVSSLGLNSLIMREVARNKDKTSFYFGNSLVMEVLLSALVILLIFVTLSILGYPKETCYIAYVSAVGLGINAIGQLCLSIFTAYECREYEAITNILGKLIYVLLGLVGIYLHLKLIEIVILFVASFVLRAAFGYFLMLWKVCKPKIQIKLQSWLDLLKLAVPFALSGFLFNLYFNIDMSMLSYMKGDAVVGWYAVAYRFISLLLIFPNAFIGSIWPIFSRLHVHSRDKLLFAYKKSVKYLLILAIPIAFGTTLIADNLILAFFGYDYVNSIIALQILIWAGALLFITYISGSILGSIDKPELTAYSLLICVIVNVSLNLYLIPHYSYVGAAIATVITEIVLFVQYYYHLSNNGIKVNILNLFYKPFTASVIMSILICIVKNYVQTMSNMHQVIIVVPLATVTYIIALIAFRTFGEEDITIFKDIIGTAKSSDAI